MRAWELFCSINVHKGYTNVHTKNYCPCSSHLDTHYRFLQNDGKKVNSIIYNIFLRYSIWVFLHHILYIIIHNDGTNQKLNF